MRQVPSWEKGSERFCTTGDAARILNCSTGLVRYLETVGRLRGTRTVGGVRLYLLGHIEGLARERAASARCPDEEGVSPESGPIDPAPTLSKNGNNDGIGDGPDKAR